MYFQIMISMKYLIYGVTGVVEHVMDRITDFQYWATVYLTCL